LQRRKDSKAEAAARVEVCVFEFLVDFFAPEEGVAGLFDNGADEAEAVGYGPCFFDFAGEPFGRAPV